ncbi:MAG: biosynthetic-type acetolactate synthase large subunit [Chloroflexi bacterium]|nr:biosynthetic-type acetolactate synthase large subunit [Chloroflexota bacterium]
MRLNGARTICQSLVEEGVNTIFGLPGGAIMPLYDVLPEFPQLRHILVRHEQCAAHMADGYARAAGGLREGQSQEQRTVGVCFGTSGPGATNLVTGICNAHMDSVPLVAITANVPNNMIGTDAFQEADITGITIPITKQNFFVRNGRDLPRVMREAFHLARTGRPGPVHVDVPKDVLLTEVEWTGYPTTVDLPGYQPTVEPNMRQVKEAARLIEKAQRPVIIAGQGVLISAAWRELRAFAEKTNIPVITTLLGISSFPETHPLSLGFLGMHGWVHSNYAVHNSDLVIAIGMRMDDRACGKFAGFAPQARIVHVDIDPAEIGKNVRVDVPIVGDVARVLSRLEPEIGTEVLQPHDGWIEQIREWRNQYPPKTYPSSTDELYQPQVLQALYETTRGKAIVVADVGQHQMFAAQHFLYDEPYSYITSGGLGTMGYSIPAAIGAQMARPDRQVWCVVGDGCFQQTLQELAALSIYRVPVKVALLNNEYLGMVRQQQQVQYRGNLVEVDLAGGPDYIKIAQAYGIPAWRVTRPEEMHSAIGAASANAGPAIIEFRVARTEDVYPWVLGGTSLGEVLPDTPYEEPRERVLAAAAAPNSKDATDR